MVKRRKSRVQPPPCHLSHCVGLLSGAWTANVIWFLRDGERCFTELLTDLNGISPKMLTARLRKLQRDGVVVRVTRQTSPPTVWYALTPPGQELCEALTSVVEVAQRLTRARGASAS